MGSAFGLGPGGKGSNQAVAAARAGARVRMLTKLGEDAFGEMARRVWAETGIDASLVRSADVPTGSAVILIDEVRGENGIVIVPGTCFTLRPEEVERSADAIAKARVLLVQLELPIATVERGLRIARDAGVTTILNPAPSPQEPLTAGLLALADFVIPNESEAARLTGLSVDSVEQASEAARALQANGARHVLVTLGERGVLVCPEGAANVLVPAFHAGPCVETTGAGDAFCGCFAAALAEGRDMLRAARFASAAAGISVTRAGATHSMPHRQEIEALLASA